MANINVTDNTKIYQLKRWYGLNESPDGDTGLKLGEAAEMRNFRITRESHLQIRPGYAPVCEFAYGVPVRGMWSGYVNGEFHLLVACNGHLWDVDPSNWSPVDLGDIDDGDTHFFGFSGKVYLLTGGEYYTWDGISPVHVVDGYAPVVVTAAPPEGGGTLLERVNILTGKKRAKYSPDGTSTVFQLPETEIGRLMYVDGTDIKYSVDLNKGTVTFESAPPEGINTITFTWRKGSGNRQKVTNMRFAEFFNGASDSRIFFYGDGTNEAVYSDLDEDGLPNAEYIPDLNVMAVGTKNTPVTAMIRHYNNMLVHKTDGTYSVNYDTLSLDTGTVTAAFYCTPINREIGCAAVGQARLVRNNVRTLFGRAVYEWALSSYAVRDERNAKRISDRVESTLTRFDLESCITFDDELTQEYYIICGDEALIHNCANDTWYYYTNIPAHCMGRVNGELYFGTNDGKLMHFSRNYRNDAGGAIDAYWESGSLDFDMDWKRKYSANIWVSIKPETQSRVFVTAQSNRKSDYMEKEISYSLSSFANANFAKWSFGTNRKPQVQRARLKVKKFTFYKLIFKSKSTTATSTILSTDFQIRYTGNVK